MFFLLDERQPLASGLLDNTLLLFTLKYERYIKTYGCIVWLCLYSRYFCDFSLLSVITITIAINTL